MTSVKHEAEKAKARAISFEMQVGAP